MKTRIAAILLTAGAAAYGATLPMETLELRLGGKMDFSDADGHTDFLVESGLGYFILDNIALGGLVDLGYDGRHLGLGLGGYGEYNVDVNSYLMPYGALRAQLCTGGYYRQVADHNFLLVEPAAGMKFFVSENLAIFTELYLAVATEKAWLDNDSPKRHDTGLKAGLRCYF